MLNSGKVSNTEGPHKYPREWMNSEDCDLSDKYRLKFLKYKDYIFKEKNLMWI